MSKPNLPNPFKKDSFLSFTSPSPSGRSSPGFLMLTRPPSASTIGHDGRGRSMGRANYKSSYHNTLYSVPYSNQNKSFDNYKRSNEDYDNSGNYLYHSPNNNYFRKSFSFAGSPSAHSTPNFHRKGKPFYHKSSFSNSDQKQFKKTHLKDVPIDKFISIDMVKDPWETLESSINKEKHNDDLLLDNEARNSQSFNKSFEKDNSNNNSFSVDGVNETLVVSSTFECDSVLEETNNSPVHPFSAASVSDKDTGIESDG